MEQLPWIKRAAGPSDFGQISRYGRSGRRGTNPEYFAWKLINNPVREGFVHVADHNGQVVGTTTITPKRLGIKGKQMLGAEIGDTFTEPAFQRRGIFTALVNMSREKAINQSLQFIYGTPNNKSLAGYEKKCQFRRLDALTIQLLVRPVNFENLLSLKVASRLLTSILSPVASALFLLRYPLRVTKKENSDFTISKLEDDFPQSVNVLANKSLNSYEWVLFRDKTYLDWRFIRNPDNYDIWLAAREEHFLGYVVCKIGTWKNLRVGYLADFLVDEERRDVYPALLSLAMRHFIENKVDIIAAWAVKKTGYSRTLKRRGFLKAWNLPLICYQNETGAEIAQAVGKWHFTMADSDNI